MEEISEHRIDKWETLMFTYESALKEIATKIDILNNEFIKIHNYNPIGACNITNQVFGEYCKEIKAPWLGS